MPRATDELLKTHRMIKRLLEKFSTGDARFLEVSKTLRRAVAAHAWFEETIFHPALKKARIADGRLFKQLAREHDDLDQLFAALQQLRPGEREASMHYSWQIRVILETHLRKEKDALYPLAEKALTAESLAELARKMEALKSKVRDLGRS